MKNLNFLSLKEFLHIFDKIKESFSYTTFLKSAIVKIGNNTIPLKTYVKEKQILSADLKTLYENILNKNDYLTRFYKTSLDVESMDINDPPMKRTQLNNNELVKYKNPIRNMHYKAILESTQSGFKHHTSFLTVLKDLYNHHIIDYKLLTPSGIFYMNNGRLGSVFSSYYFRASIMNPFLVYSINMSILHGTKIFTPTLGWTSYAYGFLECPYVKEYVGCDVIPSVCDKTRNFIHQRYPHIESTILCEPSENLAVNRSVNAKYKNHFDVVFFSPPYYELEIYPGANQSTTKYKSYDEWLEKYWRETIILCHNVLKRGGQMCYILSNYGGENNKYDLLKDMNTITKEYFTFRKMENMYNKNVYVTADFHRNTDEKIMIFVK